jgi:hypothetical protein
VVPTTVNKNAACIKKNAGLHSEKHGYLALNDATFASANRRTTVQL